MNSDKVLLEFLSDPKGLLIAPAGHGKTYSIAQMVSSVEADKPQLILTHTHAGIASLKKKFKNKVSLLKNTPLKLSVGFFRDMSYLYVKGQIFPTKKTRTSFQN